jgi:Cu-Zn family superoxide dismutase
MIRAGLTILVAAGAAGAALAYVQNAPPPVIEIKRADGTLIARAMLWRARGDVEVRVQAAGLPAGHYGVHLHAVGRCEGPAFASAGAHWNPAGRQHGSLNPAGHHLGDLPNLDVDQYGAGRLEFAIVGASLSGAEGLFDADGTSLVIHAAPDDYRTDPSGNSGARIACGVLRPS